MTGLVELVIFKCLDECGSEWFLVEPEDVPLKIKDDPDVIAFLESGCVAQFPGESVIYMGQKVEGGVTPLPLNGAIKQVIHSVH